MIGKLARVGFVLSTAFLLLMGQVAGAETPTVFFSGPTNFPAGSFPRSLAVGDFNADGRPDLAVPNSGADNVSILLGNGTGGFTPATPAVQAVQAAPEAVAVGDFNEDGHADLAVTNGGAPGKSVSILLGTGTGNFGPATTHGQGPGELDARGLTLGDFNGDGHLDLAAVNHFFGKITVLLGNGTGSFGPRTDFSVGQFPSQVVAGDFNGDGDLDLAVSLSGISGGVSVLLGTGTDGFSPAINIAALAGAVGMVVDDFDGDGDHDVAVAVSGSNAVAVFLGNGAGGFGAQTNFPVGATLYGLAGADFNGDGHIDLAAANPNTANASVLLGDGAGAFGAATPFPAGTAPVYLAPGDFNGDSRPDLAVSNTGSNNVSILLSDGVPPVTTATLTGTSSNGWYRSDVAVSLSAADNASGVASTAYSLDLGATWNIYSGLPFVLTNEGTNTAHYRSTDVAGNIEETKTVTANIDKTAPQIDINAPVQDGEYVLNQPVAADWSAVDNLSGLASAGGTVPSGANFDTSIVGARTFDVTAEDLAGNQSSATVTYYVRYDYGGIGQPINADGSSVFKLGSTVPVKFQLMDSGGDYIGDATARIYVAKMSDSVVGDEAEAVSTSAATTGNLFRYDSANNQYVFNLATKGLSAGTWKIRVSLDDGSSKYALISLK